MAHCNVFHGEKVELRRIVCSGCLSMPYGKLWCVAFQKNLFLRNVWKYYRVCYEYEQKNTIRASNQYNSTPYAYRWDIDWWYMVLHIYSLSCLISVYHAMMVLVCRKNTWKFPVCRNWFDEWFMAPSSSSRWKNFPGKVGTEIEIFSCRTGYNYETELVPYTLPLVCNIAVWIRKRPIAISIEYSVVLGRVWKEAIFCKTNTTVKIKLINFKGKIWFCDLLASLSTIGDHKFNISIILYSGQLAQQTWPQWRKVTKDTAISTIIMRIVRCRCCVSRMVKMIDEFPL